MTPAAATVRHTLANLLRIGEFCTDLREAGDPDWRFRTPDALTEYDATRHPVLVMVDSLDALPCVASGVEILQRVFGDG